MSLIVIIAKTEKYTRIAKSTKTGNLGNTLSSLNSLILEYAQLREEYEKI